MYLHKICILYFDISNMSSFHWYLVHLVKILSTKLMFSVNYFWFCDLNYCLLFSFSCVWYSLLKFSVSWFAWFYLFFSSYVVKLDYWLGISWALFMRQSSWSPYLTIHLSLVFSTMQPCMARSKNFISSIWKIFFCLNIMLIENQY